MSWPEQSVESGQDTGEAGTTLGTPLVVSVVCNTVVDVVEYATVSERTFDPVVMTVAVLSDAVVDAEPLAVTMASNVVSTVVVNVVGTGTFVVVDETRMVSRVVVGTVTVWVVVPPEEEVALLNGAVVGNGCKVEEDSVATPVGKG